MDFSQCSFKHNLKTACGSSRGETYESVRLIECDETIEQHLKSCNLWRKSGLNEIDLILARAGHFGLSENKINSMNICPRHRHNLGKFWRLPGTCRYPLHTGPRKKPGKDYHVINVAMARDVQAILKNTVAIGSRELLTIALLKIIYYNRSPNRQIYICMNSQII